MKMSTNSRKPTIRWNLFGSFRWQYLISKLFPLFKGKAVLDYCNLVSIVQETLWFALRPKFTKQPTDRWNKCVGFCGFSNGHVFFQHSMATEKWPIFFRWHFQMHFCSENIWTAINISFNLVTNSPITNKSPLVQAMDWHRTDDKSLLEPTMTRFNAVYMT